MNKRKEGTKRGMGTRGKEGGRRDKSKRKRRREGATQ